MNRTRHAHLIDAALIVAIIFPIALTFLAAALVCEIHQFRLEFSTSNAQWRRESIRRIDQLMWKADTGLELFGAMRIDMGTMINKLRVQVKQSSDESTQSAKKETKVSTAAVTEAIYATHEPVKPETITVVPEKTETIDSPSIPLEPDATVNAPTALESTDILTAQAPSSEAKKKRSWYSHIWRWW